MNKKELKKICPIMSRPMEEVNSYGHPSTELFEVTCRGGCCQLWNKAYECCGLEVFRHEILEPM